MTARLSKASTLVLLISMTLALAAGLLAWGPVVLTAADHAVVGHAASANFASASFAAANVADVPAGFALPNALAALTCLPLCAVCVWGLQNTLHAAASVGWPVEVSRPWGRFFALAFMMSASSALYHLAPDNLGYALSNTFAAGAFVMLLLGFLAERVDARFGSNAAIAAGLGVALAAGAVWLAGDAASGRGDLRPLLFLQSLPVLLLPAGALGLPGRHTSSADWVGMLGLYAVARWIEQADSALLAGSAELGGHALMHLLLAAAPALLAYRALVAPTAGAAFGSASSGAASVAASPLTQRKTSMNTSG